MSGGSAGQIAAGAIRVGNTFGAALANRRVLGAAEAKTMAMAGGALALLTVLALVWPRVVAWPLALLAAWSALALLLRAHRLQRSGRRSDQNAPGN